MENLTIAQMTAAYNELADKPVTKFRDKATATERLGALLWESRMIVDKNGDIQPRPSGRTEHADHCMIDISIGRNPKREGSAAHTRFALLMKATTVGAYKAAVIKNGGTAKQAMADLLWDVKHQYVTVWTDALI